MRQWIKPLAALVVIALNNLLGMNVSDDIVVQTLSFVVDIIAAFVLYAHRPKES